MRYKCNFCDKKTNKKLDDLYDMGWYSVKIGNKKAVRVCNNHQNELNNYLYDELAKFDEVKK